MTVYLQLLKVFGRNFEARTSKTKILEKISRCLQQAMIYKTVISKEIAVLFCEVFCGGRQC